MQYSPRDIWCCEHEQENKRLRAEVEHLRDIIKVLEGFTGHPPSPIEWKLICELAQRLRKTLDNEKV